MAFGFDAIDDMTWMREQLRSHFGDAGSIVLRVPIGQLVKSMISGRTLDEISSSAYGRLTAHYTEWSDLAAARPADVQAIIGEVTFPEDKARYLGDTLRLVAAYRPDFDLAFLGRLSVTQALDWLERLPGVGRKVAGSRKAGHRADRSQPNAVNCSYAS